MGQRRKAELIMFHMLRQNGGLVYINRKFIAEKTLAGKNQQEI